MGSDDGGVAGSEGFGATRVTEPGRVWCKCLDHWHPHHEKPTECGRDVFKDGYCQECHKLRGGSTSAST